MRQNLDFRRKAGSVERNRAITAAYSSLYKKYPEIFKWCGMAAFASHRVGLALTPYYFVTTDGEVTAIRGGKGNASLNPTLLPDLDLVRQTNNLVFKDIAWAHYAYASTRNIQQIEAGLSDKAQTHHLLIDGFRAISEGERLLNQNQRSEADELIWRGNALLLQHEQFFTVQSSFTRFRPGFQTFLSWVASMDFNPTLFRFEFWKFTSFDLYMWTVGLWLIVLLRKLPNVCILRQRWFWVSSRVLPLFRKLDHSDRNNLFLRASLMIREAEISGGADSIDISQRLNCC